MANFIPKNAVVWFEIPVSNLQKGTEFYETVLQTKLIDANMGFDVKVFPVEDADNSPSGMLFEKAGTQNSEMLIHLDAPTPLEEVLDRVKAAGGEITSDIMIIPKGRFAYCKDPDGNRIGFFNHS